MIIPKGYEWLGAIGPLPRIVEVAMRDYGLQEKIGAANHPIIMDWAEDLGGDVARAYNRPPDPAGRTRKPGRPCFQAAGHQMAGRLGI